MGPHQDTPHTGHHAHAHAEHSEHVTHAGHSDLHAHTGHTGHGPHAGHDPAAFRNKFWLSLLLTIPTLIWGPMLQHGLGVAPPRFPRSSAIPAIFGIIVFVYGGSVFLRGAVDELRGRLPGMMTLIALAITVAFLFSLAVTLGYPGMPLWDELSTLVTIMLLGHWIEMRSVAHAQGALGELAKLLPDMAVRIVDGKTEEVPVAALQSGNLILVRPGAAVPADGTVREGTSAVNESILTGESRPVHKEPGSTVMAGTTNGTGALRVEVTATAGQTTFAGIMRLVEQAQHARSRAQALADRAAFVLTIIAISAAVVTLLSWLGLGRGGNYAIERTVTVLVISCPHALGLAIPLVIAISTTLGAQHGLLVRDRRGLEEARHLTTVVFDKTGTLTLGALRVVDMTTADYVSPDEALQRAATLEQDSEHAIARGIVQSAQERNIVLGHVQGFRALPGVGAEAEVDGRLMRIGGPALLQSYKPALTEPLRQAADRAAQHGQSAIYLTDDARVIAVLAVADAERPESREAVQALHAAGVDVVMMTGDARTVADTVAAQLGINTVFAEVLPADKAGKIESMKGRSRLVGMVGDGVNDAPALLAADIGIAIGAGTNVAVEAGDVVLVRNDPRDVPRLIALSRASYRKMVQNLWWATGYNAIAIPLAAGVLAPWGIVLSPAMGAILMSLSTVIVAINAQLLRRAPLE